VGPRYLILDISHARATENHLNGSLATYNLKFTDLLTMTVEALTNLEDYYTNDEKVTDYGLMYRCLNQYNDRHRKEYTFEDIHDICTIALRIYKTIYPAIGTFFQQYTFSRLIVSQCLGDDLYVECC
jgi:hypothetical protein